MRSGKTMASLLWFVDRVNRWQGEGDILVVGLNRDTVWRNVMQPIMREPMFAGVAPHLHYRQGAAHGKFLGREFHVIGANDDTSWERIQGMTVEVCLGDEVTAWPYSFWDMLQTRLSLESSRFLGTCNPGTDSHYLVDAVIRRAQAGDPDFHHETLLLRDNPFVADRVKERYERTFTGVFYRRMIEGQWVAAEGAIYHMWEPSRMVVDSLPDMVDTPAMGLDYGTNHPTAGYIVSIGDDGVLYVTDEFSPNPTPGANGGPTDTQLADRFEIFHTQATENGRQPRFIYADPAGKSFREELRTRGHATAPASNEVTAGIALVQSLLQAGKLKISHTCTNLIKEIPGYRWDPKATERGRDAPIKEHDDHVDALRYAVYSSRHLWRHYVRI